MKNLPLHNYFSITFLTCPHNIHSSGNGVVFFTFVWLYDSLLKVIFCIPIFQYFQYYQYFSDADYSTCLCTCRPIGISKKKFNGESFIFKFSFSELNKFCELYPYMTVSFRLNHSRLGLFLYHIFYKKNYVYLEQDQYGPIKIGILKLHYWESRTF